MKNILKTIKNQESTVSMVLGMVVILIVGVLLFNYFKGKAPITTGQKPTEIPEKVAEEKFPEQPAKPLPAQYTVKKGDNLWKISLEFYGSGYNWVDINRENNLKNPNLIQPGTELTIPNVSVKRLVAKTLSAQPEPITGNTYTVTKGDNLWEISVRAYQDGFKWPQIAKANRFIVNPALIHPGNVLTIPR